MKSNLEFKRNNEPIIKFFRHVERHLEQSRDVSQRSRLFDSDRRSTWKSN